MRGDTGWLCHQQAEVREGVTTCARAVRENCRANPDSFDRYGGAECPTVTGGMFQRSCLTEMLDANGKLLYGLGADSIRTWRYERMTEPFRGFKRKQVPDPEAGLTGFERRTLRTAHPIFLAALAQDNARFSYKN